MRTQAFFHRQTQRKGSAKLLAASALGLMLLFFSGCAALGGGASQMQSETEEQTEEQTSSAEATMSGEPTATRADEGAGNSNTRSQSIRAGDAEVTTDNGGSVVVRAGDAEVTTGGGSAVARAGDVVAEAGGSGGNDGNAESPADVETAELRLAGDGGTSFSGDCVVGGEPAMLEGEVPSRLDYDLGGGGLACEIEKQGSGLLRAVLTVGENQVVRETNAEDATINLVYRGGNIIASTSSSSGSSQSSQSSQSSSSSNSVVQQSSNVQSQSSNSSSQQSSNSINQSVSVTN